MYWIYSKYLADSCSIFWFRWCEAFPWSSWWWRLFQELHMHHRGIGFLDHFEMFLNPDCWESWKTIINWTIALLLSIAIYCCDYITCTLNQVSVSFLVGSQPWELHGCHSRQGLHWIWNYKKQRLHVQASLKPSFGTLAQLSRLVPRLKVSGSKGKSTTLFTGMLNWSLILQGIISTIYEYSKHR